MPEDNKRPSDEIEYVRDLARRAFRNISRFEDQASIKKIEADFIPNKNPLPKNGFTGATAGLAIGIVICVAASYMGIPFSRLETAFITAQFGLIGGLMTFFNS